MSIVKVLWEPNQVLLGSMKNSLLAILYSYLMSKQSNKSSNHLTLCLQRNKHKKCWRMSLKIQLFSLKPLKSMFEFEKFY